MQRRGSASKRYKFCNTWGGKRKRITVKCDFHQKQTHIKVKMKVKKVWAVELCNMWTKISKWESLHTWRSGLWTRRKKNKTHPLCPYLVWLTLPILQLEHTSPNIHWPLWTQASELCSLTLTSAGKNAGWSFFFPLSVRHQKSLSPVCPAAKKQWNNLYWLFETLYFWWIQKIPLWPDKYYTYSIKS